MGKFIILLNETGAFEYNLKNNNGDIILKGQSCPNKLSCKNAIKSVKRFSKDAGQFYYVKNQNDELSFHLRASNGRIIGTSNLVFKTYKSFEYGIEEVQHEAYYSPVVDMTIAI